MDDLFNLSEYFLKSRVSVGMNRESRGWGVNLTSVKLFESSIGLDINTHFASFVISCAMCFRVLQLMNLTDSRLAQAGCEKLDLALISFFEQFRKIYVGDQVQKTSKVSFIVNLCRGPDVQSGFYCRSMSWTRSKRRSKWVLLLIYVGDQVQKTSKVSFIVDLCRGLGPKYIQSVLYCRSMSGTWSKRRPK